MFKIVDKVEFTHEENKMQSIADTNEAIKIFAQNTSTLNKLIKMKTSKYI